MKTILLTFLVISLTFATIISNPVRSDDDEIPKKLFKCPEVKQEACTKIYQPTCAWMDPRINCIARKYPCAKNAGNPCMACKIRDVVQFSKGKCPESHVMFEPNVATQYSVCTEESKKGDLCPMIWDPKCAWYHEEAVCKSVKKPCARNAPNACEACRIKEVEKFSEGECPKENLVQEDS